MNYLEIEKEMTKTYDAIANKYEKEAKEDWKNKEEVDKFLKYLNTNASILDIASGTGELLEYYNNKGFIPTGIDISKQMNIIAKNKAPNANIINMSLYDIDKLQDKFDAISATFILVHIPKEKINEFINSVNQRLKDNGIFFTLFTTSLKEGLQEEPLDSNYNYYAINYSKDEICNVLKNNGFEILEQKIVINKPSTVGIVIAKKIIRKVNNMKLICKITDEDIGEKTIDMKNPKLRLGSRGIVLREDGKIAVFNKSNKNEYKLPGGGLEGNENPEEAFKREVLEETGCEVEIIDNLGTTEEYKSIDNFKQISYVFVGKVKKDTKKLNITKKEQDEGSKLLWEEPQKALELIKKSFNELVASKYASIYSTKFVVLRDRKILEKYIELTNKK